MEDVEKLEDLVFARNGKDIREIMNVSVGANGENFEILIDEDDVEVEG